jgi:hypothetical protein
MEQALVSVLRGLCPRTYPDTAPLSTTRPYVTWQLLGGQALRYVDNTPADKRMSIVQINVWADSRAGALALARSIEDALCASTAFTAIVNGEPIATVEEDLNLYGTIQDFTILGAR